MLIAMMRTSFKLMKARCRVSGSSGCLLKQIKGIAGKVMRFNDSYRTTLKYWTGEMASFQ